MLHHVRSLVQFSSGCLMLSNLFVVGRAQDGCRVEDDLPLAVTGQQGGLLVHVDQVWKHASHQSRLHHSPVLRVKVHVTDITASTSTNETWGTGS